MYGTIQSRQSNTDKCYILEREKTELGDAI
uniref:Uncharacterized protein n=1 Tax=Arundo donax TaxID=35708 RepID=A0A0A9ADH9_ARUDO